MLERRGLIHFAGEDTTAIGADFQTGQKAPGLSAHAQDESTPQVLASTAGKMRNIVLLSSLDTSRGEHETDRLSKEASALPEDVILTLLSIARPWRQKNWRAVAGMERLTTSSDHKCIGFGKKNGMLSKQPSIHQPAVFVVEHNDADICAEYLPSLGDEPDFADELKPARQALES